MHKIIHRLNSIFNICNLIIEKIQFSHVYPVFNAILIALLGLLGIILSLKKRSYYGITFEECYKLISKKDCNRVLKIVFALLVLFPIFNYYLCESILYFSIIYESILIVIEMVTLYYLLYPLFVIIICDEKYINNKIYFNLKNKRNSSFDGTIELIEKIIYYKLFVEHNNYQRVWCH